MLRAGPIRRSCHLLRAGGSSRRQDQVLQLKRASASLAATRLHLKLSGHSIHVADPARARALVEFVLDLESQRGVRRVVVETKKHRSVVLQLAARPRDELPEKSRPDVVLGLVAEIIGPA